MLRQYKHRFGRAFARAAIGLGMCMVPVMAGNLGEKTETHLIVSRVELQTGPHSRLSLQYVDGKRYLHVRCPVEGTFTVLDVSNEYSPRILKTRKHDQLLRTASLEALPTGDILVSQDSTTTPSDAAINRSLYVWNPMGEQVPKSVGEGSAHLFESRRGLLYVIDDKELVIVRLHESPEAIDHKRWAETVTP